MQIFAEKLAWQLSQCLHPCYLLCSNEPFLLQEAQQAIIETAKEQGFYERHPFEIDTHCDWATITDHWQSRSLFSARKIIELALPATGLKSTAVSYTHLTLPTIA